MLIGEWFADNHPVVIRERSQDGITVFAGQKTQAAVTADNAGIASSKSSALALIIEFECMKGVNGFDAVDRRHQRQQFQRQGRMLTGASGAGGPNIEIRSQLRVEPKSHGLAEAAHHDADAGHHGDSGCKRRNDD